MNDAPGQLCTMSRDITVIAAASSRTHGSDSSTDTPSQPSASIWATMNFTATETYRRRLVDPGSIPGPPAAP
jgi:hypothetical protein